MNFGMKDALKIFKEENPDIKISLTPFSLRKPFCVKHLSAMPHDVCLCVICLNIRHKVACLSVLKKRIDNDCTLPTHEYHLYNALICPKVVGNEFRSYDCVHNNCDKCKNWSDTIDKIYSSLDPELTIRWQVWLNETIINKYNKPTTHRTLHLKHCTVKECIDELKLHVLKPISNTSFPLHYFTGVYQYKQ